MAAAPAPIEALAAKLAGASLWSGSAVQLYPWSCWLASSVVWFIQALISLTRFLVSAWMAATESSYSFLAAAVWFAAVACASARPVSIDCSTSASLSRYSAATPFSATRLSFRAAATSASKEPSCFCSADNFVRYVEFNWANCALASASARAITAWAASLAASWLTLSVALPWTASAAEAAAAFIAAVFWATSSLALANASSSLAISALMSMISSVGSFSFSSFSFSSFSSFSSSFSFFFFSFSSFFFSFFFSLSSFLSSSLSSLSSLSSSSESLSRFPKSNVNALSAASASCATMSVTDFSLR
mmetsp:Transcript_57627/g.126266  ORF Transcript_57627/g.126266 Transcript_57627/m.126266 type:complete len:304 (-) Transcript_57627:378-1289(-)